MSIETELKYKIDKIPIDVIPYQITQIYFDGSKQSELINKLFPKIDINNINTFRLRKIIYKNDIKYIITLKTKSIDNYSRNEYELEIDEDLYLLLSKQYIKSIIIKNRYILNYNNFNFEFDEYLNLKSKLYTCEVELDSNENKKIIEYKYKIEKIFDDYFKIKYEDVTFDHRYKNVNLGNYF